ncbi:unnamed protein product, partial [Coregonus sp. 'balchen']
MGLKLISKVAMSSESDSETACPSCASTRYGTGALSSSQRLDEAQALNLFYQHFPVTVDGQSIKKKDRLLIAGRHERYCYDKWRSQQEKMRWDYNWEKNKVKVEDVLRYWQPSSNTDTTKDNKAIMKLVKSQKWKGLYIASDPVIGRKVMTTQTFAKGEVVCDYHEMDTIGRRINHSRKRSNIKGQLQQLEEDGNMWNVILFIANETFRCRKNCYLTMGCKENILVEKEKIWNGLTARP